MPSKNPTIVKALKDGDISKKQYEKMPDALLLGMIKKGKGMGVKETRKKIGKEKGKVGRPKKGSKVMIEEK
jgi:hypothetical protein